MTFEQTRVGGACLCGAVAFELTVERGEIYQCHCTKCRKVSGSSSNSAMIVDDSDFTWLSGTEEIRRFVQPSGFKSDFCGQCGSPVPNATSNGDQYWIPMGLVGDEVDATLTKHVYVGSKAHWDMVSTDVIQYENEG